MLAWWAMILTGIPISYLVNWKREILMICPTSYYVPSTRAKKRKLSFDSQLLSRTTVWQPLSSTMWEKWGLCFLILAHVHKLLTEVPQNPLSCLVSQQNGVIVFMLQQNKIAVKWCMWWRMLPVSLNVAAHNRCSRSTGVNSVTWVLLATQQAYLQLPLQNTCRNKEFSPDGWERQIHPGIPSHQS